MKDQGRGGIAVVGVLAVDCGGRATGRHWYTPLLQSKVLWGRCRRPGREPPGAAPTAGPLRPLYRVKSSQQGSASRRIIVGEDHADLRGCAVCGSSRGRFGGYDAWTPVACNAGAWRRFLFEGIAVEESRCPCFVKRWLVRIWSLF